MAGPAKALANPIVHVFKKPPPKRQDPKLFAPDPTLRDPSSEFLRAFMANPSSIQNLLPQTSALQQQSNTFLQNLLGQTPGQGVLDAATPIFQRNLQQGADILRQSGPRFASNTERLIGEQGNKAMQDFNLFSQQVMQEGINQQLTGAGLVNQQRGLDLNFMLPLLQQFFGTAFGAGGLTQPGTVTQGKSPFNNVLDTAGQVAGLITALKGGGRPGGAQSFGQGWMYQ